jgi:ribosomal protein L37AE/L43A
MIAARRLQHSFADGFIAEAVEDLWEPWIAPFSRGPPKSRPKTPGRKPGAAHGPHHRRPVPDPVDEEIAITAPAQCPACGGPLTVERVESQYQEEIVRRTWVRRFHVPVCRCAQCHHRVQGRLPAGVWSVAEPIPADIVATGERVRETFPALDAIPWLPGPMSASEPPAFFSSS